MSLAQAALLTLRRRRALMVWSAVLAIGIPLAIESVLVVLHVHDPLSNGPAGGSHRYARMLDTLDLALVVMSAMLGASAGAGDLAAGTFRDLVATGCRRRSLFLARVPAALAVSLSFAVAGFVVITTSCYAAADGEPTPTALQALGVGAHVVIVAAVITIVATAVAELVGSRGIGIGVVLGWVLAGEGLLESVSLLGRARDGLLQSSLDRFRPIIEASDGHVVPMSLVLAVLVVGGWSLASIAAGVWSVRRRDA